MIISEIGSHKGRFHTNYPAEIYAKCIKQTMVQNLRGSMIQGVFASERRGRVFPRALLFVFHSCLSSFQSYFFLSLPPPSPPRSRSRASSKSPCARSEPDTDVVRAQGLSRLKNVFQAKIKCAKPTTIRALSDPDNVCFTPFRPVLVYRLNTYSVSLSDRSPSKSSPSPPFPTC